MKPVWCYLKGDQELDQPELGDWFGVSHQSKIGYQSVIRRKWGEKKKGRTHSLRLLCLFVLFYRSSNPIFNPYHRPTALTRAGSLCNVFSLFLPPFRRLPDPVGGLVNVLGGYLNLMTSTKKDRESLASFTLYKRRQTIHLDLVLNVACLLVRVPRFLARWRHRSGIM